MKALNFDPTSWHYKVAKFGTLRTYDRETDMCHYVRSFIWGVVKGLVVAVIMGGLAFGILMCEGAFIGSLIAAFVTGYWMFEGFAAGGVIINAIVFIIAAMIGCSWAHEAYREKHPKVRKPRKPDGFIKNAYNGWKDKYCAKVVINKTAEQLAYEAEHAAYLAEYKAEREAIAKAAKETENEPQPDESGSVRDGSGEEAAPGA